MNFTWSGSSLKLNEELRSVLQATECKDVLLGTISQDNGNSYLLPYKTNIFIADEERVKESRTFREIIKYYETKVEPSESEAFILRISENSLEETKFNQIASIDNPFSKLLEQVYVDVPGLSSISRFPYSIIHGICVLNSTRVSESKNIREYRGYLFFLLEFMSLCALSTRVTYDDYSMKYVFQIGSKIDSDLQKSIYIETGWNDVGFFTSDLFSTIILWVLDDQGIPDGQQLRRSVAQHYLLGFENSPSLLLKTKEQIQAIPYSLDNMFGSVLQSRSEKYIQNINKMKDEYIDSFNQYSQMLSSANTQTVSNIFALTAAAYGVFLTKENLESPLSFPGVKWILIFFIFTTSLILFNFIGNLLSFSSSRRTRRRFYSEMLCVPDQTLVKVYDRVNPNPPKTWLIPMFSLLIILIFLLYLLFIL